MNKVTVLILSLIFIVGCQRKTSTGDCIEYIDSLKINLENTTLRVALIDLTLKNNIRPYTIFFDNHLIVLNKQDSFYTFHLDCFNRDTIYEKKLNTKEFKKAFVAFDNLYGIDVNNQAFRYENKTAEWVKSNNLPLLNNTPIYENDKYICYRVFSLKMGGFVFFYDKQTEKTTFVPADHAVSLMEQRLNGFYIVEQWGEIGHGSSITKIENPDSLFRLSDTLSYYDNIWEEMDFYYSVMQANTTIENKKYSNLAVFGEEISSQTSDIYIYGIDEKFITSGFKIKDDNYFILNNYKDIYLTKLQDDSLVVINTVDIVFSGLPSNEGEITRKINNNTIIDYSHSSHDDSKSWFENEYSNHLLTTFIINDTTLIRINWY